MNILFVSSVSLISNAGSQTRELLINTFGLPLKPPEPNDEYVFSEKIAGSKHFGVWPLRDAAQACFGSPEWPNDRPIPQASIEFEVENEAAVGQAAQELEDRGYVLLHPARTEPWGQTVARMLTHEGAILGISYAPWLHNGAQT